MREARQFPRINLKIKVAYEFVSWKENIIKELNNPKYTTSLNISSRGVKIANIPEIRTGIRKQLIKGKKKIKLAIYIYDDLPPVITFARLVWSDFDEKDKSSSKDIAAGLMFIDVSIEIFNEMEIFINKHLKGKK